MSGSSIGTIAGGLIGGILGFFLPVVGTAIGFAVGSAVGGAIGGFIDAPKTPELTGPRLTDLSVQTSTYGAFIPRAYGKIGIYGNIFWIENNKIKETSKKVRQGGKGIGGGGASTKTYTYSATFAIGLCEGPIAAIGRIWIGSKLFYDAKSNDIASIILSNKIAEGFELYLGTEDQLPDPRMQATLGGANTPAYRGLAYIVFYDLPLADYGNSLAAAQIKVEIIKNATYSSWARTITNEAIGVQFKTSSTPGVGLPYIDNVDNFIIKVGIKAISNKYLFDYNGNYTSEGSAGINFTNNNGDYYNCGRLNGNYLWVNPSKTIITGIPLSIGETAPGARLDGNLPDNRQIYAAAISNDGKSVWIAMGDVGVNVESGANQLDPVWFILDSAGVIVRTGAINYLESGIYTFGFARSPVYHFASCSYDQDTGTIASAYGPGDVTDWVIDENNIIQRTFVGQWSGHGFTYPSVYKKFGFIFVVGDTDINIFTINLVTQTNKTLASIVSDECLQSRFLTTADIDVTELTDIVSGYRISELGAIRGGIDPLRTAWPFDAIQSGYQIYFKRRGSASVATIDSSLLDARSAGSKNGVIISQSREMDSVLHRKVLLKYFDVTREYDINQQYVERINTDAVNESIIDLPIVLNANEAAQKAEVLLYLYWMERNDLVFNLPPTYSQLEPGDVITITGDNADHEVRLTGVNSLSDGRFECKAKYNKAAIYSPVALGDEGQSTGVTSTLSGPSTYELLDIPLIQMVYDEPGFVLAMTGYLTGWTGGVLYRSTDNGQTFEDVQAVEPPGATMGIASTTIGVHGGTVLDKTSLLTVHMTQGDLSSVTQSQMFDGQNWFAYGADGRWEIIACQNSALQGNGDYILSDFLRGQMGTEWATGLHAVGDIIVHLNSDELAFIPVDSSTITASYIYRGITDEDTIDSDSDKTFSYDGVNLECLSPCQETGSRHPTTNDWTIKWTRRTRYAGWRSFVDAELAEDSESYEIDIFSSAAFTTIKRTLTSTTQTVQYTSAQQITDFGSNQSTIRVKIYQMSALVGRGYALTATLTRT